MSQLLTTVDVALRLSCSAEQVRALANSGKLPAERTPSGTRIYRSEDVERVAAEREARKREKPASVAATQ